MNRPNFVPGTAPAEWLVTPRTGESPARRAYAIFKCESESHSRACNWGHKAVEVLVWLIAGGFVHAAFFV